MQMDPSLKPDNIAIFSKSVYGMIFYPEGDTLQLWEIENQLHVFETKVMQ